MTFIVNEYCIASTYLIVAENRSRCFQSGYESGMVFSVTGINIFTERTFSVILLHFYSSSAFRIYRETVKSSLSPHQDAASLESTERRQYRVHRDALSIEYKQQLDIINKELNIKFPDKIQLANLPTPIQKIRKLSDTSGIEIYIKRDDMTGGVETGNKIRKLEYVLAHAINNGYDTIVTCGGADSNHARATAIAAAQYGLSCFLILRKPKQEFVGNLILNRLVNAHIHFVEEDLYKSNLERIRDDVLQEINRSGGNAYWVPTGASMPMGAVGYVNCTAEIAAFQTENSITFDRIIFATGSGGTAAGLLVGIRAFDLKTILTGINNKDTSGARHRPRRLSNKASPVPMAN